MREHTKWVMILVAIAFVALMVFEWGMDLSGRSSAQASGGELGRIDGEPISNEEYNTVYRNLYNQQQQAQDEPVSAAQNRQLEQAAWDQVISDRLIQREIERRGITATDEEIRNAARFAPPPEIAQNELFQTNGQFDPEKYRAFLSSPSAPPQLLDQLENYYREIIPRTKLMRQVVAGVSVTDADLWRRYREQTETARVRYIALDPEVLVPNASVKVTDAEMRDYYKEHEKDFDQPAKAGVRYIAFSKALTPADTAAARQRAAEVRQRILGGQDFGEVAKGESSDKASAVRGGELGTLRKGQTVPEFEKALFSQPIGQVGEPVQTQFGFHIIQVQERDSATARARHILIPIRLSGEHEDQLVALADSMEQLGERSNLESAAKALGLQVQTASLFEELPNLQGIGDASEAVDWTMQEGKIGETSPVFENSDFYYMLQLVSRNPKGRLTFEQARPQLQTIVMRQKKNEKALAIGKGLVEQIRTGRPIEQAAASIRTQARDAGPFSRADFVPALGQGTQAVGAAFGLKPGQVSNVVEGASGPIIVQLIEKKEPNRGEFEQMKESLRASLVSTMEQERWSQFLASLKSKAEIVDLREELRQRSLEQERQADEQQSASR